MQVTEMSGRFAKDFLSGLFEENSLSSDRATHDRATHDRATHDRATKFASDLSAPPPPIMDFKTFLNIVQNLVDDSDDWLDQIWTAYGNVPQFSPKREYEIAVQTAVESIQSRKGMLTRSKRAGTIPSRTLERREGGDEL